MKDFVERHFGVVVMLFLLTLLMSAHAFMIHAGRPHEMITWVETIISQVFAALIPILTVKKDS